MKESHLEITSVLLNQLTDAIESILEAQVPVHISEYALIKTLQSQPYQLLSHLSLQDTTELFQLHFLIFHCLYKAKDRRLSEGKQGIDISPLQIKLSTLRDQTTAHTQETARPPKQLDTLASYYLDLSHLTETSSNEIEDLILSFWTQLHHPSAHQQSLAVLELSPPVTYQEIKLQYKRLASKHHPDKGGCKEKLQSINQAMATLSQRRATN